MILVSDIEADGYLRDATRIWCSVSYDITTGEYYYCSPEEGHLTVQEYLELLDKAEKIIFHGALTYDLPLLKRLYGYERNPMASLEDTLVLSQLLNPDRQCPKGTSKPHSIEAWGIRFKMPKGGHTDFTKYSPEMLEYCKRDVDIGARVWQHFQKELTSHNWQPSRQVEYWMARIQTEQELHGVLFDQEAAYELVEELEAEIKKIDDEVLPQIPPKPKQYGSVPVNKPFLKGGGYSKPVVSWYEDNIPDIGGPFTRIEWHTINLNSDEQVKDYLLSQGWRPTQWNYKKDPITKRDMRDDRGNKLKSSPKLTEDSYASVEGKIPELVTRRNTLVHRRRQVFNITRQGELKGWLNLLREDGRIEAQGTPQATNTGRYRHRVVVNVPKADPKVLYGEQMRALFIVPDDMVMVGCDASALEARMEAHECYDFEGGVEYAHELIDGDIHAKNAKVFGTDRNGAKSPKYALTYGSQAQTLAETIGCSVAVAQQHVDNFWRANTALAGCRDSLIAEYRRNGTVVRKPTQWGGVRENVVGGWISGLDGRKLHIRSPHALVNTKFQSGGSIIVKTATIFAYKEIKKQGVRAHQIIHMHDEIQYECHPEDVDKLRGILLQSFRKAGEYWKLKVPIEAEVKTGRNWAETH